MTIALMYHDVCDDNMNSGFQSTGAFPYKVGAKEFEQQVALISKYCNSQQIDKGKVIFTFDDGGKSFLYTIAGILEQYGFIGYFFIATAYIDTPNFLTSNDVVTLRKRGHIIGAHSHTHPERMDILSPKEVHNEWETSTSILNKLLDEPITIGSVPNGYASKSVYKHMINNGIKIIYDSFPTTKTRSFENVPIYGRYAITKSMSSEMVMGIIRKKSFRSRILFRYRVLQLAKSLLGNSYLKIRHFLLRR